MKNVKLMLLAATAMLFLGLGTASAQESPSKTVIIRILETTTGAKAGIVTIDAEGKISKVDLEKGGTVDASANNGIIIHKELEKWKQEGYKITHLSISGEAVFRTTIILEK